MSPRLVPSLCLLALVTLGCSDDEGDSDTQTTADSMSASASASETTASPGDGDGDGDSTGDGDGDSTGDGDGDSTGDGDGDSTGDGDGDSTGDGDGDGGSCSDLNETCAMGESCCGGLACCAGVPVPPGEEYCGDICPDSDWRIKRDFAAVDSADVLARLVALPISTWSYKADEARTRHIGPMAQDFLASFEVGGSERKIFKVDADGVSFTAIQALHTRVVELEAENGQLRESLETLEQRLAALEGAH